MKLLIEKSALEAALRRIIGVVDKRNTIAILSNVMITTQDASIQLRVTDLDMEAIDTAPCAIETPGAFTVEAAKLYDIARNFQPGAQILFELTADDPRLTVSSGRSRFRLPVLPVSDFPALQAQEWPITFMVPGADLARIFARSSYAMGANASQYIWNSVFLRTTDGALEAVATDGKRMGRATLAGEFPADLSAVIPTKMITEITRRLADWDGDVMVCARPGRLCLITGAAAITSKLIDGDFRIPPSPTDGGTIVSVDGDQLAYAIRAALLVNSEKLPGCRLMVSIGKMVVTGRGGDAEAVDEIDIDYDGPEISFGSNATYMMNAVTALDGDTIDLEFRGDKKPLIIRKSGDDTAVAMIAPMMVGK